MKKLTFIFTLSFLTVMFSSVSHSKWTKVTESATSGNTWYVDFDRCLPFFNEHQGCAICIAVCPWSRPGIGMNLAQKLMKRAQRREAQSPYTSAT